MLCRSVRTSQGEDAGGRGDGRWEGRDPTCEVEGGEEAAAWRTDRLTESGALPGKGVM